MHLHEYQAKRLFPAYGLLVPAAEVVDAVGPGQVVDEMPGSRLLTKQTDPGGVEPVLSA